MKYLLIALFQMVFGTVLFTFVCMMFWSCLGFVVRVGIESFSLGSALALKLMGGA